MNARTLKNIFISAFLTTSFITSSAFAFDNIIRPYQSARTSGMGGVFETTGLYDQNFYGNPARVTANPTWRLTIFDPMVETDSSAVSHVNAITSSGNTVQQVAETAAPTTTFAFRLQCLHGICRRAITVVGPWQPHGSRARSSMSVSKTTTTSTRAQSSTSVLRSLSVMSFWKIVRCPSE